MPTELLLRLISSGRVSAPNYFNGRLLSAGDLRSERDATRELLRRVARAAGTGIAAGFEVTATVGARSVQVRPGLALGPYGDALQLDDEVELRVAPDPPRPAPLPSPSAAARFRRCQPTVASPTEVANPGLHLLAVGPASGQDGAVATSALNSSVGACAVKDDIAGLRFVLLPFRKALEDSFADKAAAGGEIARRSRFRSRMARACFGFGPATPTALGAADPSPYGLLATLTDPTLPACHVPLAVVSLTQDGIEFVDQWAARRGLAGPPSEFEELLDRPRRRDAEALVQQFNAHAADVAKSFDDEPGLSLAPADTFFVWLPPVGVLPTRWNNRRAFFGTRSLEPELKLPPEQLARVLGEALALDPIDLADPTPNEVIALFVGGPRRQALFATRRRRHPLEADAVADAFAGARRGYGRLTESGELLPPKFEAGPMGQWVQWLGRLNAVVACAVAHESAAKAGGLGPDALAVALVELARIEIQAFEAGFVLLPSLSDATQQRFGALLKKLSAALRGGVGVGILPAVESGDLPAAVTAQRAVNGILAAATKDPAAPNDLDIAYSDSPSGRVLLPVGGWTPHRFRVTNPNDVPLDVVVTAAFENTPAGANWAGQLRLPTEQFRIPVARKNRDGSMTSTPETVVVYAHRAKGVANDVEVTLRLTARVAGSGRAESATVLLKTADSPGNPTGNRLDLDASELGDLEVRGGEGILPKNRGQLVDLTFVPRYTTLDDDPAALENATLTLKFDCSPALGAANSWSIQRKVRNEAFEPITAASVAIRVGALKPGAADASVVVRITCPSAAAAKCGITAELTARAVESGGLPNDLKRVVITTPG